jgi:hypothetical protein
MNNLRAVFERFRQYGIKLKPRKCDLCKQEVSFFGRPVNKCGMAIGEEYVEAIKAVRSDCKHFFRPKKQN